MKTTLAKKTNDIYEYIYAALSQGRKIAVPEAILDQEDISIDEMRDYFIVEKGSFGLLNFMGFRRAI